MPISIKRFEDGRTPNKPYELSRKIYELLKNNKDKAYCGLDFQNEFKVGYSGLVPAIRILKRDFNENLIIRWVHLQGNTRMLYYAYKEKDEKDVWR